jgi:MFS family permease
MPESPFSVPLFRSFWIAAAVSNLGTFIQDVGQGWLMTSLTPSPFLVSLVSASLQLPGLVLALPAGVLADLADRRRLLLFTQSFMASVAALMAALTAARLVTPWTLLLGTLAMGTGMALNAPAWQAVVPDVVPRLLLPRAVVWNGVAWNVARAVGPAIGGVIVASLGAAAAFLLNAVSFLYTIMVLQRFAPPARPSAGPPERFASAIVAGLRYCRHSADLRAVVGRCGLFGLFASSGLALLPVICRDQLHGGPSTYGLLLGCIGLGAITAAVLRSRLSLRTPLLQPAGIGIIAAALLLLARADSVYLAGPALALFGLGWLAVMSSFNTAAQLALPVWVRARGLGIYLLVFSGAMSAGSAVSGYLASEFGLGFALTFSSVGLAFGVLVNVIGPLPDEGAAKDLTTHVWAQAPRVEDIGRGPVIVILRYPLAEDSDLAAARRAVRQLASIRLRDGATGWRLYEDAADPTVLVEVFTVSSWEEHLRQHHRGTVADRAAFAHAEAMCGGGPPEVTHLVAAP